MSPTLVDEPPAAGDWITEVKWDGYRTPIAKDDRGMRALTRNGHDWSTRYWTKPGIVGCVRYLRGEEPLRHATLRDWRDQE